MSNSKSLKTDSTDLSSEQELVWKRLNTVLMPVTTRPDLFRWQQGFARGLRGAGKNEVVVMMAKSGTGKSMYYDIEAQNE